MTISFRPHFFLPVLLVITCLEGGCTTPREPTVGDKMQEFGKTLSNLGEKWKEGENMIEQGQNLIKEGEQMIQDGYQNIAKGKQMIQAGEQLKRASEQTFKEKSSTTK